MLISDEHLDDFIERWRNAFDETLRREEARVRAAELLELYKLLIGRLPSGDEAAAPPTPDFP